MSFKTNLVSPAERARHRAWRGRVRQRFCVRAGSADDRCLSRIILAWRTLRARIAVMDRHGHDVASDDRERLAHLERVLGEHEQPDPCPGLQSILEAAHEVA